MCCFIHFFSKNLGGFDHFFRDVQGRSKRRRRRMSKMSRSKRARFWNSSAVNADGVPAVLRPIDRLLFLAGEIMAVCMLVLGLVEKPVLQQLLDILVHDITLNSASRSLIPLTGSSM